MNNQPTKIKNLPSRKIKNSINDLSYLISQLRNDADISEEASVKYNRMLIERASLRKKCKETQSKSVISILFRKFSLKKDPKSICDYFESN